MTLAVDAPPRRGVFSRLIGGVFSLILGTLLTMTAGTSILVLGWLMRRMRARALRVAGLDTDTPGWILGTEGGRFARLLGGFAANIREGLMAATSIALATAPFAVIWLLSWWAGWENSFSKGYEQAFVGPALGLFGVAVFCITMVWLPLALAHQAVENRALALFEIRRVRSALRHTGWSYLFLALATVFFALPIFASRGLVVFASGIVPGFDDMTPDQISALADGAALVTAAYAFVTLVILKAWAASIYARAVARALETEDAALWKASPLATGHTGGKRPWRLTHWLRLATLAVIWFGLAAQIFVAQFLNHDWHVWLTHPLIFLPWTG